MPIYAYKCESCGHAEDVLQKISAAPLDTCPQCGKATYRKQVTAAGFQLKGSGWYVTDFRGGASQAAAAPAAGKSGDSAGAPAGTAASGTSGSTSGGSSGSTSGGGEPAAASPAPAATKAD